MYVVSWLCILLKEQSKALSNKMIRQANRPVERLLTQMKCDEVEIVVFRNMFALVVSRYVQVDLISMLFAQFKGRWVEGKTNSLKMFAM